MLPHLRLRLRRASLHHSLAWPALAQIGVLLQNMPVLVHVMHLRVVHLRVVHNVARPVRLDVGLNLRVLNTLEVVGLCRHPHLAGRLHGRGVVDSARTCVTRIITERFSLSSGKQQQLAKQSKAASPNKAAQP